jgi:hypothetical protein
MKCVKKSKYSVKLEKDEIDLIINALLRIESNLVKDLIKDLIKKLREVKNKKVKKQ